LFWLVGVPAPDATVLQAELEATLPDSYNGDLAYHTRTRVLIKDVYAERIC
jgi:hypothetical protein